LRAFTLVEVTLALGIAGFCLITIFGLLPVGLSSNQASFEQTAAANISSTILTDLRSAQPLGTGTSSRFGILIPAPPGSSSGSAQSSGTTIYVSANGSASVTGQPVTSGPNVSRYRVTIGFYFPPSGQYSSPITTHTVTNVRIMVTWPALADSKGGTWTLGASPSWPTNYVGAYEAETTLDRN
jgi:type II secretory pathway pseudopilin PulG